MNFRALTQVNEFVHQKMIQLFNTYLVIGGMPDVVRRYCESNDFNKIRNAQKQIINFNRKDISQYCAKQDSLYVKDAYDLIASELNNPNKRFYLRKLDTKARYREFAETFIWLVNAGVAIPVYNVSEPTSPLLASHQRNLFKLFMGDVGLLVSQYSRSVTLKILNGDNDINCGAMFENAVAQELFAHGFKPYYYNNKKRGELDFVIEDSDGNLFPIEIKSGKAYKQHRALCNILDVENYDLDNGYVFCASNVTIKDKIVYLPIYMIFAMEND